MFLHPLINLSRSSLPLVSLLLVLSFCSESPAQAVESARKKILSEDLSPFVRRHADDLVKWHVWDDSIFEKAKAEKKPLYVCVGYDSCHWCVRMQQESFVNPEIAKLLNDNFINVIVDRERRPDLDTNFTTYMNANQGQSGWPLNVWVTPDGVPFSVGSYFPNHHLTSDSALPDFAKVLNHIISQWNRFPDYIDAQSKRDLEKLSERLKDIDELKSDALKERAADRKKIHTAAYEAIATRFDPVNGGFSSSFQFPEAGTLKYLSTLSAMDGESSFRQQQARKMITLTGDRMSHGGIFDQLAGGFHRYALDVSWEVPRFEKLLLTQAVMADCYVSMYKATGNQHFAEVARTTLGFVQKSLSNGDGLYYAGLQSDSEVDGNLVEGAYYTWTYDEFVKAAGEESAPVLTFMMDVKPGGNLSPGGNAADALKNQNVLRMKRTLFEAATEFGKSEAELATLANAGLRRLAEARALRPAPALDDNVVPSWNALLASAFVKVGLLNSSPEMVGLGKSTVNALLNVFYDSESGMFYHLINKDGTRSGVYAGNYASFVAALLDVYHVTFDERYLATAVKLQDKQFEIFWDTEEGGFFESLPDRKEDILRLKGIDDDVAASTNATSANNLLHLADITGDAKYMDLAKRLREFSVPRQVVFPGSVSSLLEFDYHLHSPSRLVVVTGPADSELAAGAALALSGKVLFRTSLLRVGADTKISRQNDVLKSLVEKSAEAAIYVVESGKVSAPLTTLAALEAALTK
jgi:uncharacterized protein YyaL (SSP411 family)